MAKFRRAQAREVEAGGEAVEVTLDAKGVRVGAREVSWGALFCALAGYAGKVPADADVRKALAQLRGGSSAPKALLSSGEGVADVLKRLDAWLKKNRKRYHKGLQAGASERDLAALAKALGKPVPDDLAALLRWHNGQDEDMIGSFVESFNLMSASEIAHAVEERKGTKGWPSTFIPILDDYQDDYVVVDASKPGLPVREVWRGRDDHPQAAASLRDWLAALAADVEAGRYAEESERGQFIRGKR